MSGTISNEAAGIWFLDCPPEVLDADKHVADSAALLIQHCDLAVRSLGGGIFLASDGAWLREGSAEFFIALGDPDPDYDAPLFAIKNLGFIFVRVAAASLVEVTLHARNVEPAALRTLHQWLHSLQFSFFKLNYMTDRWISEILTTPAQLMGRLFEISALEMPKEAN